MKYRAGIKVISHKSDPDTVNTLWGKWVLCQTAGTNAPMITVSAAAKPTLVHKKEVFLLHDSLILA